MTRLRNFRATPAFAALLVVVLTALGAGAGAVAEHLRGEEYQVDVDVLVRFWSLEGYLLTGQANPVDSLDVADVATLASGLDVLDAAAETLDDGRSGAELSRSVAVTAQTTSNAITISATAGTAAQAATTAQAVGAALVEAVDAQVNRAAASLAASAGAGGSLAELQQRAAALTSTVEPLEALAPGEPTQTSPDGKTPLAMGVVGLAAAALVLVGLVFGRPLVGSAREAQRLLEVPAVPFGQVGDTSSARLLRRLLDDRPAGTVLVVPVDERAEEDARSFVAWARAGATDPAEAARVELAREPAGAVLRPRPGPEEVAAVLLLAPAGTRRRELTDAAALLRTWRAADAAVVVLARPAQPAAPAVSRAAQPAVLTARSS